MHSEHLAAQIDTGLADMEPPMDENALLASLNEDQAEAVRAVDGPVLILAGAGTGKTRVLISRFAYLVMTGGAHAHQILAVTFTNKAAREMSERIGKIAGHSADGAWLGTFHSIGVRILRRHAELIGLDPQFTILDTDDQIRLMKQIFEVENIDPKRWPVRVALGIIQRWKDRGHLPDKVPEFEQETFADGKILDLYKIYQQRLGILNAVDFGDLLLMTLTLFQTHPDVLAEYQNRFTHLLVDEYQDTNVVQYLILRLLAQKHKNICCVGDDDQSIYSWRGAEVENILRFEKDFPGAKIFRLEQNYRSTPHILAAASAVIACNRKRLGKSLWTETDTGELVKVRGVWDGSEEARSVGDEVEALHRKGHSLNDMAILVRAGFQTREFEERFLTLGVPYKVLGGLRFYERQEIRDALAYIRVVMQPDDGLAFERIVSVPRRGIGTATLQIVHHHARFNNISLPKAVADLVQTDEFKPKQRKAFEDILKSFERWRGLLATHEHARVAEIILDESGYTEMWQKDKSPDAPARLENLRELITAMEEFETMQEFLEHVSLVTELSSGEAQEQMITLMTLHGAKGLEFDVVFLPGWEEGVFPHQRALDEMGEKALEEERRLAYVGITRAKQLLHIYFAANRRVHNQWQSALPSRFISELPNAHIDKIVTRGMQGYGQWSKPVRSPAIESVNKPRIAVSLNVDGLQVGQRIFHQKFGYGKILKADGDKLEIAFEKAGVKKVMQSFVSVV